MIIYKCNLPVGWPQRVVVNLPIGARILSAGSTFSDVFLWVAANPNNDLEERKILMLQPHIEFDAGQLFGYDFLNTVKMSTPAWVATFHIFQERR